MNNGFINLNHKDSKGDSALSLAVAVDMQHLIPDLIAGVFCTRRYILVFGLEMNNFFPFLHFTAGADVNIRNGEGLTLLHQAILKQDTESALFLLNQGANVDAR